jgi:3-hydroxyisobutyrate dehydrogenase-like beta-hydroxyacid dehydrogenase
MRVGFLGLGIMGAAMAKNLLGRGHDVVVWARNLSHAQPLLDAGARPAATPRETSENREVVIAMVSDEHALASVLAGTDGVLAGLPSDAVFVQMSTVGKRATLEAAAQVKARGARFVDAPVSGSRAPAIAGKLLVMAGGDARDIDALGPIWSAFGRVRRVGDIGDASAIKLLLNALGAQMLVALENALGLGARMGVDLDAMMDVIEGGAFSSPLFASKRARLLAPSDESPDFTIALWEKDQRLTLEEAARHGYGMPQLEAVRGLIRQGVDRGLGDEDMTSLVKLFVSR